MVFGPSSYRLSEAEAIKYLVQLDRIGIIELKPLNRYRLKLAKNISLATAWRGDGLLSRQRAARLFFRRF